VGEAREAVLAGFRGADEIEAEERQIREVVRGESLAGQVGVDQAEPLETAGGGAKPIERRDEDVVVRTDDHKGDLAPAGDQNADLAVDFPGELRKLAGQVMGDDPLRRDAPPVKLSDPLDLCRSEAGQVAVYLFDNDSFFIWRPLAFSSVGTMEQGLFGLQARISYHALVGVVKIQGGDRRLPSVKRGREEWKGKYKKAPGISPRGRSKGLILHETNRLRSSGSACSTAGSRCRLSLPNWCL
jgi:hypothetical protein